MHSRFSLDMEASSPNATRRIIHKSNSWDEYTQQVKEILRKKPPIPISDVNLPFRRKNQTHNNNADSKYNFHTGNKLFKSSTWPTLRASGLPTITEEQETEQLEQENTHSIDSVPHLLLAKFEDLTLDLSTLDGVTLDV